MNREWKPGTVAVATVRGIEGVRVFRVGLSAGPTWLSVSRVKDCLTHEDKHVTRVRPLVVLDPQAHRFYPELLVRALRTKTGYTTLADAIEAQACPPKPPKPPEPTGLGAVVEDSEGRKWLRVAWSNPWCLANPAKRKGGEGMTHGSHVEWGRIDAVRVLSEGVTDA